MPINTSQIYLNLDTNKPNVKIDERFLQGNTDKTLNIKFLKNNEPITITDGVKATLTLVFYNGSSVYKKYVIKPTLDSGGNNTNYKIPAITNNMLTIPFTGDIAFVDHAGRTDLIIKIDDSGAYYTYSCSYNVDVNEAYNPVGIIDNLPSIDGIKADVSNLKTEVNQAKTDITSNTQALTTKASKDLSNVGTFAAAPEGSLLYKKDGQLKSTPIVIDDADKIIDSPYSLKVPANTIDLGDNISLKENGGFINFYTKASGKYYVALDYENDAATGSKNPVYYERGPVQTKVELQNVDTTTMNNVTSINLGVATSDIQVQAIYLKLVNSVNNFKAKLTINSKDVAYYPSKAAWDGTENGLNLVSGLQRIPLSPFWSTITGFNRTFTIKADGPINLLGNGTTPYIAEDLNPITKKDVALMEDIPSVNTETGASIRDKLENLTGNDRLNATAIKNLPTQTVKVAGEQGSPEYDATKLLFPFANSVVNDSGNVTVNTSFVVTDENNEIVPDCSIIEVPTTSLISANQNQGNSNAAVLDFKGIPIDMGDTTPVINTKYLRFPQALVINEGDKTTINTAPEVTSDGSVVMGRTETFEFPSDGGLKVEGVTGTDAVKITSKGFKATRNGVTELDGVKTLAFNDDDLIIGTEDITDSSKLNVEFLGLPISKTNTSTIRKATKLEFPQANVFGQDGGTVHIGTGHSISKDDDEITAAGNSWVFGAGLNVEINPNDPNGVIVSSTDSKAGISINNDDTQPVNETTIAYYPQARIEDGSTSGSKVIKTSTPISHNTDNFEDYKKISIVDDYFTINRKTDDNDTLELGFNGISVENGNAETPAVKIINFDVNNFNVESNQTSIADVSLKNATNNGFLAYYSKKETLVPHGPQADPRETVINPSEVVLKDKSVSYNPTDGTINLMPKTDGTVSYFKIATRVTISNNVTSNNWNLYLYLWDIDNNQNFVDTTGKFVNFGKMIKKGEQFDYIDLITVIGVDHAKNISIKMRDTASNSYIDIQDIITGTSAIAIERVDEENSASLAMLNFETLTQQKLRINRYHFNGDFDNISKLLQYEENAKSISDNTVLNRGSWIINVQDASVYGKNGDKLQFKSNDPTFSFFTFKKILDYETTWALRGKTVEFKIDKKYQTGEFELVPAVWRKQQNKYNPIIVVGMNGQGTYGTSDGWTVIDASKVVIPAPTNANEESTVTMSYQIPDDAINVAFMLMPTKQAAGLDIQFTNAYLSCDPEFTEWIVQAPFLFDETRYTKDNTYAKFVMQNTTPYNFDQWYQLDETGYTQLYIGEMQAGATADVVKVGSPTTGTYDQIHNVGRLKFNRNGTVKIKTRIEFGVSDFAPNYTEAKAECYWAKDDGTHSWQTSTLVPGSEFTATMQRYGNVWNDSVRTNAHGHWEFTMNVKAGDEYILFGKGMDTGDGHFYCYPDGTIEVWFLQDAYHINALQTEIEDLKNMIIFTDNAKTTNTKLKIDNTADGNTPTVTATTTP